MARSLLELRRIISTQNHSFAEWLSLDQEVNEAMKSGSEEEINEFVDSGAGEELDMMCAAIKDLNTQK